MAQVTPQEILDFWFSEKTEAHWFVRSDDLDQEIKQRFSAVYEQAVEGALAGWKADAESALALTIIFDQFPRNIFRGSPKAFASDPLACALSKYALEHDYDMAVDEKARQFFYLPLMHSEAVEDQEHCVKLYKALGNDFALGFAREHRDIVKEFGRFPHRNAVLGRQNTPEETEFLKTHTGF